MHNIAKFFDAGVGDLHAKPNQGDSQKQRYFQRTDSGNQGKHYSQDANQYHPAKDGITAPR
jgi:hypothetical protein